MAEDTNQSALVIFKEQAAKLIEGEIHELYSKAPSNLSLGKKHWGEIWKRLNEISSRVQIFDHPMQFQPILDHLWSKYAELTEETNQILRAHGQEGVKKLDTDSENSSEEEMMIDDNNHNPEQDEIGSKPSGSTVGWKRHIGASRIPQSSLPKAYQEVKPKRRDRKPQSRSDEKKSTTKPPLPPSSLQADTTNSTPERVNSPGFLTQYPDVPSSLLPLHIPQKTEEDNSNPGTDSRNQISTMGLSDEINVNDATIGTSAAIPLPKGLSIPIADTVNWAEMIDKMQSDDHLKGRQGIASIKVDTDQIRSFIVAAKDYYEETNDEDMLDELLELIERGGDATEVTIEGWMADLYADFQNNGQQKLNVSKFSEQREQEKLRANLGVVEVEVTQGQAVGYTMDEHMISRSFLSAAGVKRVMPTKDVKPGETNFSNILEESSSEDEDEEVLLQKVHASMKMIRNKPNGMMPRMTVDDEDELALPAPDSDDSDIEELNRDSRRVVPASDEVFEEPFLTAEAELKHRTPLKQKLKIKPKTTPTTGITNELDTLESLFNDNGLEDNDTSKIENDNKTAISAAVSSGEKPAPDNKISRKRKLENGLQPSSEFNSISSTPPGSKTPNTTDVESRPLGTQRKRPKIAAQQMYKPRGLIEKQKKEEKRKEKKSKKDKKKSKKSKKQDISSFSMANTREKANKVDAWLKTSGLRLPEKDRSMEKTLQKKFSVKNISLKGGVMYDDGEQQIRLTEPKSERKQFLTDKLDKIEEKTKPFFQPMQESDGENASEEDDMANLNLNRSHMSSSHNRQVVNYADVSY